MTLLGTDAIHYFTWYLKKDNTGDKASQKGFEVLYTQAELRTAVLSRHFVFSELWIYSVFQLRNNLNVDVKPGPEALGINNSAYAFMLT